MSHTIHFFFSSRRRHTRWPRDWSSDVCSSDLSCRLRKKGGSGGHNGLQDIEEKMGRNDYPRIRVGIGSDFYPGQQVDYVLSEWTEEEEKLLPDIIQHCADMILSYTTIGAEIGRASCRERVKRCV